MFGDFPVNDSWIFVRQVEAFREGIFTLSALLDPSFIAQGFLGYLWSHVFGTSFTSFKVLTLIVTLFGVFGFFKILEHLKVKKNIALLFSFILFFNPLVFTSAFTFMTDNYFLTFVIYTTLFLLRFIKAPSDKNSNMALRFIILAILVRQLGVIIGIAFIISHWLYAKKKDAVTLLSVFFAILFCLGVIHFWPRFGVNRAHILFEGPIILERLKLMFMSLAYFPIFAFPAIFAVKHKKNLALLVLASVFAVGIFTFDVFPVGNVLYIEKLYTKSNFRTNFSLFDNIYFKTFISAVFSYAISKFIFLVKEKKFKLKETEMFLVLSGILNFAALLISSDFYDRYLLPSFLFFLILFAHYFSKKIVSDRKVIFSAALLGIISIFLTWDYSVTNDLKWRHAGMLRRTKGLVSQVDLNNTYTAYAKTRKAEDFTGQIDTKSFEKTCFIQDYTLDSNSQLMARLEDFQERFIDNPKPYNSKKKQTPRVKNNLDKLLYNEQYYSPLYSLVGKKSYVGTWCL